MTDTEPAIDLAYRARLMRLSAGERIRMASGMFDAARALIRGRLRVEMPDLCEAELRVRVFEQVYGQELKAEEVGRIAERLRQAP